MKKKAITLIPQIVCPFHSQDRDIPQKEQKDPSVLRWCERQNSARNHPMKVMLRIEDTPHPTKRKKCQMLKCFAQTLQYSFRTETSLTSTWRLLANLERFLIMNIKVKIRSFIVSKRQHIIPLPHQVRDTQKEMGIHHAVSYYVQIVFLCQCFPQQSLK